MNLSLIEIIELLQQQGHEVEYSHRKDGGYIIRKIDGRSFSGKAGNTFARNIVGAKLSQARQVQLAKIRLPKGKKQVKLEEVPEDVKKMLKKVQKSWRKKHPDIRGTATMKNVRYFLRTHGKEATMQSLDKSYRYSQGYAYIDNVNHLIERIRMDLAVQPSSDMEEIINLIERKMMEFREEWLQAIYSVDVLYAWEQGRISDQECARRIREIIL